MQDFNALTILKYRLKDEYLFHVMDKFEVADEPARLDKMIDFSLDMEEKYGEDYEQLWIKTCPIFPATPSKNQRYTLPKPAPNPTPVLG